MRPDYWSGSTTLPRVIQHRNVMSLTWRLTSRAWMSHCFFEQERFDEVRFEGNWAFGRVGKGYVGIYSQNGLHGRRRGAVRRARAAVHGAREHLAGRVRARGGLGLVRCLRARRCEAAPSTVEDGVITYASPSIGRFVTGWDVTPTVNGEPIQLHGYPMVDSPWASAGLARAS